MASLNSTAIIFIVIILSSPLIYSFTADQEKQIQRFQQYLRINTAHPSPDYAAAADFLLSIAKSIGLQTQSLEFAAGKPLILLSWPGSSPSLPSVLLNSHIDSVPAEPLKWLHSPFDAVRDSSAGTGAGRRIYGRGAQDDKCLAVQYLEAIRHLKAAGFKPIRTVHVSLVSDEEIGGADGHAKFVKSKEFRRLNLGFMLDEGQASTTDEFRIFYADRLPWWLIVKAVGAPGHGSKMFDGAAVENLMDCVEFALKFRESQFDQVKAGLRASSEVISVNPSYMKAGTPTPTGFVMNMQPSEAEVGFDVRLPPTADPELLRRRIAEEWAPAIKNMTFELTPRGPITDNSGIPLVTATNGSNPWWVAFNQAIIASGNKLAKPEILSSTTDARYFRQMGIPVLGFSPMSNTPILLHDHNEFLEDSVFIKGIEVYQHVIKALSSVE